MKISKREKNVLLYALSLATDYELSAIDAYRIEIKKDTKGNYAKVVPVSERKTTQKWARNIADFKKLAEKLIAEKAKEERG